MNFNLNDHKGKIKSEEEEKNMKLFDELHGKIVPLLINTNYPTSVPLTVLTQLIATYAATKELKDEHFIFVLKETGKLFKSLKKLKNEKNKI